MRLTFEILRRLIVVALGVTVGALGVHQLALEYGWTSWSFTWPVLDGGQRLLLGFGAALGGVLVAFIGLHLSRRPRVFQLGSEELQPGGQITVNRRAVRALVMKRATSVEGVAECTVRSLALRRKAWRVSCEVVVQPDAALKTTADEVRSRVASALEQQTGVPAGRLDVRTSLATAADGRRVR